MKEAIKKLLPANRFARNVSVVAGGTAAGQAITVVASPLLTRLYTPEDFGLLAVYASLLMTFAVIASLRYQLAIPLPEDDHEASKVVVLSLFVVLCMSLLLLGAVILFRYQIARLVNTPSIACYLWLLPPGLFMLGTYQVFNYWAVRVKSFTAIARTKLAQSITMVSVQVGGFFLGPIALLIGHVAGHAIGSSSLGALAMQGRRGAFQEMSPKAILRVGKRYRRFPLFSTWAGAFNSAGTQLPPLLFAALFSPAAAGLYMLAHRVLSLPMVLVGRAIGQVFFSSAAEAQRNGTLGELVLGLHNRLSQIAMPPALFLFITGPDIFAVVFGENWRIAGEAARWLSPMLYLQFIVSPLSQVNAVLEKQVHGLFIQAVLFVSRVFSLFLVWHLGEGFIFAVMLYGIMSFAAYVIFLFFIMHLSGIKCFSILKPTIKMIPPSFLQVVPVLMPHIVGKSHAFINFSFFISFSMMVIYYSNLFRGGKGRQSEKT